MTVKALKEALSNINDEQEVYINVGACYVELENVSSEDDMVVLDYGETENE